MRLQDIAGDVINTCFGVSYWSLEKDSGLNDIINKSSDDL